MPKISIPCCLIAFLVALDHDAVGVTFTLTAIDSGNYRWLDVADQTYGDAYRNNYRYTQAQVQVTVDTPRAALRGVLVAKNLKPNFTYQLKLEGTPGTAASERIGLVGRWWQEEWNGTAWVNGANLNDKGTGYAPTPNDTLYFARRDIVDPTSPSGKRYRYTGYLVFDYFITDSQGNANVAFQADSSYHVLWKSSQRARETRDGPLRTSTFTASKSQPAYAADYPQTTVSIFGEWERLPVGGTPLTPGDYAGRIILTEESFHGSGGQYAGGWAAAMSCDIQFQCVAVSQPRLTGVTLLNGVIAFAIEDCTIGYTNQVERSFDLLDTNGWQSVFGFVSDTGKTNWSEPVSGGVPRMFYRVKSQTAP